MTRVLGLDLSLTSTGAACVEAGEPTRLIGFRRIMTDPTEGSDVERADYTAEMVVDLYTEYCPDVIAVENYAYSKSTGMSRLGELGGIVKLRLWEAGYHPSKLVVVPSSSVKKFATGDGRADKKAMTAAAAPWFGFTLRVTADNDIADALHIARYVLANA